MKVTLKESVPKAVSFQTLAAGQVIRSSHGEIFIRPSVLPSSDANLIRISDKGGVYMENINEFYDTSDLHEVEIEEIIVRAK